MASNQEIAEKLRDMAVNTGTLNCLGCGFEHNCSVHGCAVLKQAAELILVELERMVAVCAQSRF